MSEQTGASTNKSISFGPFRLLPAQQLLLEADKPVHLGSRALAILIALTERAGELLSKDELLTRVWPNTLVDEGNLRVHVAALRRALGEGQAGARYVANIPGRGYRFVAPVSLAQEPKAPTSRAPGAAPGRGLPLPLMRVVGRGDIVCALAHHLEERRFITIVGPGGIGKTTVALAVAHELSESYEDGIRFVDLASLADPALVTSAVAAVLGHTIRSDNPIPGLVAFLADKQMLLVLDSCEHVIEAAAVLAVDLLKGAPGVHILATSREPLRAEGERVQRLAPLELPPVVTGLTAAEALGFPAIQLFVERTAAVLDGFELSDADAPTVAEICCKLDGIALAIELAAGRVDAFGLRGVAARLDDRFRLLTRGRRTALPRHQTLSATLDWSYELLPEAERLALRRLSVFAGGFTLDAASAVVTGPEVAASEVADIIANLVAKSLVTADVESATPEYRLLDTTRAYALAKLSEAGEREQVSRRHTEYYRRLLERAEAEWETRRTAEWLDVYGGHADNVRAALDWALSPGGDASIGVALTAASAPLWAHFSLQKECLERAERALALLATESSPNARHEMQLLAALGYGGGTGLWRPHTDTDAAWTKTLDIAESLGDIDYQLRALWGLWAAHLGRGEISAALALAQRFRSIAANNANEVDMLVGDRIIGFSLHLTGDQPNARWHTEHMISRYVAPVQRSDTLRFQYDQQVVARLALARILWLQGFPNQAMRGVESNIEYASSLGHALSLCNVLAQAACPLALFTGDLAAAERFVAMLLDATAKHGLDSWYVWGRGFVGVLQIKRGDVEGGLKRLRGAIEELAKVRFAAHYIFFLGDLAEVLGRVGRISEGLAAIDEALKRSERNEERWCVSELLRIRGELVLLGKGPDAVAAADEHFQESLDWARRQGALSWELRTSISRARLRHGQGRIAEARGLLATVYHQFSEGFATADLKAAKDLLDGLA